MDSIEIVVDGNNVEARLLKFPEEQLLAGVKRYNEFLQTTIDTVEKYSDMKLCNYKRKWWIYYGVNHMTGSFSSKKKAIGWFVRAGR